jgi:hypothetical protein
VSEFSTMGRFYKTKLHAEYARYGPTVLSIIRIISSKRVEAPGPSGHFPHLAKNGDRRRIGSLRLLSSLRLSSRIVHCAYQAGSEVCFYASFRAQTKTER